MTKNETARWNMATSTQQVLDKHEAIYDGTSKLFSVPALVKVNGELVSVLSLVDGNFKKQQANKAGASLEKGACLKAAADLAFEIADSVGAAAAESGDPDLASKVAFSRAELERGSDKAIITRLESIHEIASGVVEDIGVDYGVTAAKLTDLEKKTAAFTKAHPKPRARINVGSTATKQLKKNFKQLTVLLRQRIDRLMTRFSVSHPDFYNEYKAARRIVQPATNPAEKKKDEKKAA